MVGGTAILDAASRHPAVRFLVLPFVVVAKNVPKRGNSVAVMKPAEAPETRPRAWHELLSRSVARDDWEHARREWEFSGRVLEDGDEDFEDTCQLCHQPGLRTDYEIRNVHTDCRLLVGAECVRHYLILSGTTHIEDSRLLFDRLERRAIVMKRTLRPAAAAVLVGTATWDQVYALHKGAQQYLEVRSSGEMQGLSRDKWLGFLAEVAGVAPGTLGQEDMSGLARAIMEPRRVATPPASRLRNPSANALRRRSRFDRTTTERGAHTVGADRAVEIEERWEREQRGGGG